MAYKSLRMDMFEKSTIFQLEFKLESKSLAID